jgi:hypothetical protein
VIPLYWIRMPKILPGDAGAHRWVWDLRYPAPVSPKHEFPIAAVPHDTPRLPLGPLVVPGQYTVKLTAGGQTVTAPLIIKIDPRVKTPAEGLQQEFNLEMRMANALSHSSIALLQARSLREQAQKASQNASGATLDSVKKFIADLGIILEGPPATPPARPIPGLSTVNENIGTLYGMAGQSDSAPTAAQTQAARAVEHDLVVAMSAWDNFRKMRLPAMNRQLQDAGLPPVRLEAQPQIPDSGADEE